MVGGAAGPEYLPLSYGKKKSGPFSGQRIDSSFKRQSFPTFFVISRISSKNETFHGVSPFLVEKAITSSVGDVKATKKLRSGDLLVEVESPKQAKEISKLKSLSTIPVTVKPHATLNSSKGVISCGELLNESEEKITEELKSQGGIHVRRITIRRDGQLLNTKHLILTFDSNKLPENIRQDICAFLLGHIYQTHSAASSANVSDIRKLLAAGH
ncbi:hypothetical protein AVEN_57537-1 [Araneus ventricosus]|uniref:Uncharacterized protein n=1 Tax=Araneus ventricosus TaxID=182803 RepID=A0A4Y2V5K6_ARAVE|nr:hypothetical protein AVEN_57537-1 [Araneus ventricosus]